MKRLWTKRVFRNVMIVTMLMFSATAAYADSNRVQFNGNGHWYQRFDTTRGWNQAKAFCESLGGTLATITSSAEDSFVYSSLGLTSPHYMWLGATDRVTEGDWRLVNNERVTYTQWESTEPNNCSDIEHYLMYFDTSDSRGGTWNDIGTGVNAAGKSGGCGCGGCIDEWFPMSTICEWNSASSVKSGITHRWAGNNNASDSVGGNDGRIMGGAGFGTGRVGQAFVLDGVDDYISIPDSQSLNFGDADFSISLWVKFNTLDGEQIMAEKYIETLSWTPPSSGWTLTKLADNQIFFWGGPVEEGVPHFLAVTPPAIQVGSWNQVVVTRTGQSVNIYWNGELLGSDNLTVNLNSSSTLKFGHRGNPQDTPGSNDDSGFYLNGSIDEVTFYNHALTTAEVRNLFSN